MAESTVIAAANAELRKVEAAIAKKPDPVPTPSTVALPNGRSVITAVHAICRCGRPLARYANSESLLGHCISYFQNPLGPDGQMVAATPNCSRNVGDQKNEQGNVVNGVLWNVPAQQVPADKQPLKL